MFIDVILPLALPKLLSYSVPSDLEEAVRTGIRVAVQVGRRKLYAGIVLRTFNEAPPYATKPITSVLDATPIVNETQLRLWRWIADYYLCSMGEVMKAALPAALKMESETRVSLNSEWEEMEFDEAEAEVIDVLQSKPSLSIEELTTAMKERNANNPLSQKRALATLQAMLQRQLLHVNETLNTAYKPHSETFVTLHPAIRNEEDLNALFAKTKRAPQQEQLLLAYVAMAMPICYVAPAQVPKKALIEKAHSSDAVLKACAAKNFFTLVRKEVSRLEANSDEACSAIPTLSAAQQTALESIRAQHENKQTVLLHGVTSSGKTEIYMHLIAEALAHGKQVLYLLPEIALTAQLINRLKKVFANVGVYHSKFSDAQRVETYQRLLRDDTLQPALVLGVRSSLFLPYSHLGLVIVDEEHENTYKQHDPAPRYHARDAAIVLAQMHGAKVLLGSATPAIESYCNATSGKYGLVELGERYGNVQLPEIRLVNIAYQRKQNKHFSPPLLAEIDGALQRGEQVILFQNRRGFSPYVECKECGWIPQCEHCNVSLTYHKRTHQLVCHYCGYAIGMPRQCLACGGSSLETQGFGTEKIEEELQLTYPNISVARMDLDTTRTRTAYERLIADFEQRKIQVLVGTQMVTKGLDFDNVSLVGILNADSLLSYPDFRAAERSYQLMAQVAGRAGRRGKQGLVLIQTVQPRHAILQFVLRNDYRGMYAAQLADRQELGYPPFVRLVLLTLKHRDEPALYRATHAFAQLLKDAFGSRVLGPSVPVVGRIQNRYLMNFLLKLERTAALAAAKAQLLALIRRLNETEGMKQVEVVVDVDTM